MGKQSGADPWGEPSPGGDESPLVVMAGHAPPGGEKAIRRAARLLEQEHHLERLQAKRDRTDAELAEYGRGRRCRPWARRARWRAATGGGCG